MDIGGRRLIATRISEQAETILAHRYYLKDKEGNTEFVHTLNSTAIPTPRILVSLVENFQTEDGRIKIPKPLQKYMGDREFIG